MPLHGQKPKQRHFLISVSSGSTANPYMPECSQFVAATKARFTKDEERTQVLEKMALRRYEDMVAGRITEENFNLLLEKTQKEQAE